MEIKKVIAREWLIFLALIFPSVCGLAIYKWVNAPETPGIGPRESPRMYDVVIIDGAKGRVVVPDLFFLRDFVAKHNPEKLSEFEKEQQKVIDEFMQKGWLTVQKRDFWSYLGSVMRDLNSYISVIVVYLLYLLIRSIVWSARTFKA